MISEIIHLREVCGKRLHKSNSVITCQGAPHKPSTPHIFTWTDDESDDHLPRESRWELDYNDD